MDRAALSLSLKRSERSCVGCSNACAEVAVTVHPRLKLLAKAGWLVPLLLVAACDVTPKNDLDLSAREAAKDRARAKQLQAACSSPATYDRLKQVAFDEAIRIRNADPANLDILSTHSVVRMERPIVKSRDEELDVTVCSGRFILEIPPGAERAFGGERRLAAEVEYSAQGAADGSGLVYQIQGAEPIIYKLAAFDLKREAYRPAAKPGQASAEPVPTPEQTRQAQAAPPRQPPPAILRPPERPAAPPRAEASKRAAAPRVEATRPAAPPRAEPARSAARVAPSFNCRYARTRSERMVCGDGRLAGLDRAMSSEYYSALSRADSRTRAELRRSRDRFLGYRERCGDQGCVASAYRDRIDEIRDIAGE
jgi:hypothetical protein